MPKEGRGYIKIKATGLTDQPYILTQTYEKQIQLNKKLGKEAEDFVMDFEKKRLGAAQAKYIDQVSSYDSSAGYDIVSYENENSRDIRRYIEVKSCNKNLKFYLTKNEIERFFHLGSSYYLYLVDRTKMNQPGYVPTIIQNPYLEVITNNNDKRAIERIKVTLNK